jgi:hypothetical protein
LVKKIFEAIKQVEDLFVSSQKLVGFALVAVTLDKMAHFVKKSDSGEEKEKFEFCTMLGNSKKNVHE